MLFPNKYYKQNQSERGEKMVKEDFKEFGVDLHLSEKVELYTKGIF